LKAALALGKTIVIKAANSTSMTYHYRMTAANCRCYLCIYGFVRSFGTGLTAKGKCLICVRFFASSISA
jgi:hypothetical protein